MMEDKVINQKEYLKKYISLGDDVEKKKKKKKKHKVGAKKVKVIDDDIDLRNMRSIEDDEFDILLEGENAPQIAGIVDERGPVDFSNRKRWKIITENDEGDLTIISDVRVSPKMTSSTNSTNSCMERRNDKTNAKCSEDDTDLSPPRSKHSKHKRSSSNLHSRSKDNDSDFSPPRQSKNRQSKNYDSDLSPPRQSRNDDSDSSPPRRSRNNDLDLSPPRRSKNYDSDLSPPKKNTKHRTSTHATSGRNHRSSDNRNSDSDFSPPRRHKRDVDDLYENKRDKKSSSLTASRFKERHAPRNTSPHSSSRKVDRGQDYIDKNSSRSSRQDASRSSKDKRRREYNEDRDHKSRQYSDVSAKRKKSRWDKGTDDPECERAEHSKDRDGRMTKTLDGKKAGLQDARALRKETEVHKRREMEQFSKLSKIVSGVGQVPVVRDKTGRRRNLEAEAAEEREREIQQREMDEKYSKWGKGLKQVEDHEERLKNDLYEMSKPLARYADDADLDKELREQEKEGDPMLEYIKQKQIKEGKRKPDPPKYHGSFAPNRFGIKPGHRWDGVDRSNGYEKKWFESQNEKTARHEEAYKWSTADM